MAKGHKGNPPECPPWTLAGELASERPWLLYTKRKPGSPVLNIKLTAKGRAPTKANYWLAWGGSWFLPSGDGKVLAGNRPELYAELKAWLLEHASTETLRSTPIGDPGPPWRFAFDLPELCGAGWRVHERPDGEEWTNVLLTARHHVDGMNRYRLAWNGERLARSWESQSLEENRPELYRALVEYLEILQ